jgi:hypothetical protein
MNTLFSNPLTKIRLLQLSDSGRRFPFCCFLNLRKYSSEDITQNFGAASGSCTADLEEDCCFLGSFGLLSDSEFCRPSRDN